MREIITIWVVLIAVGFAYNSAKAEDTTINYKGQPPPAAMAPSISAFGNDVCTVPVVGAISSTVIGISGGTMYTDTNCERIKLSREMGNQGLKVAAIAILCQDERVWDAMLMSGSPCPIDGLVGDAARNEWIKQAPKRFEKLYGKVPNPVALAPAKDQ
jgi:hypothetical protein